MTFKPYMAWHSAIWIIVVAKFLFFFATFTAAAAAAIEVNIVHLFVGHSIARPILSYPCFIWSVGCGKMSKYKQTHQTRWLKKIYK